MVQRNLFMRAVKALSQIPRSLGTFLTGHLPPQVNPLLRRGWAVRYEVQQRGKSGAATNVYQILLHVTSQTLSAKPVASILKHLFHLQASCMVGPCLFGET